MANGKLIKTEFFYGIEVTEDNKFLSFQDADGQYNIDMKPNPYSHTCFIDELNKIMVAIEKDVVFSFDRSTCRVKITTATQLDLLIDSGVTKNMFELLGFTGGVDLTGQTEYVSDSPLGKRYAVQFCPQSLLRCEDNKRLKDATISESISGKYECFHCGEESFFEFNLRFITDIEQVCFFMLTNPNGVQDARDLFDYMICKRPLELTPDCDFRDEFYTVVLDQTPESRDGTGYELKEMYAQGLCGYYETGLLRFKCIEKGA